MSIKGKRVPVDDIDILRLAAPRRAGSAAASTGTAASPISAAFPANSNASGTATKRP